MNAKEESARSMTPFPREKAGEYAAVEHLRQVHRYSRITACLLDDALDYVGDDDEHAAFLERVAVEALELAMQEAETAMRLLHDMKHARDERELMQVMGAAA